MTKKAQRKRVSLVLTLITVTVESRQRPRRGPHILCCVPLPNGGSMARPKKAEPEQSRYIGSPEDMAEEAAQRLGTVLMLLDAEVNLLGPARTA